jgi:hypothetical protein
MPENQEQLSKLLLTSYSTTLNVIDGIDLKIIVYSDPAWQLRDVLWHIAVWDRQVTKSIQAFKDGREYSIPGFDEDKFNDEAFLEGKKLTDDQILEEYDQARRGFIDAVQEFPVAKYSSDFLYPWGDESGNLTTLVEDMHKHDQEHLAEINAVIQT